MEEKFVPDKYALSGRDLKNRDKTILEKVREGWYKIPNFFRGAILAGLASCATLPETVGLRATPNKETKTEKSPVESAPEGHEEEPRIDRRPIVEIYKNDFAPYKRFQTKTGARQLGERLSARLRAGGDDLNKTRYGGNDYFLKKEYKLFIEGNDNIETARENEELRRSLLEMFEEKCAEYKVPLNVALGVAGVESGGMHYELDPEKRMKNKKIGKNLVKMGGAGDTGIFQITPSGLYDALSDKNGSLPEKKPNPKILLNLEKNIDIGIKYLRKIYETYAAKKWSMVPVFYNEGPGGVLKNLLKRPEIRKKFDRAAAANLFVIGRGQEYQLRHLRKMIQVGEISVFDLKNPYSAQLQETSEQFGHVLRFGKTKKIAKSK